jgi:type II secretory pathway pseudopilin PulG
MDPLLLEKLVREIVHNEITGNWLYWVVMLCVAIVAGSLGSYVVAYFKKRAEDEASLQALQKITRTIEEVKTELQARHTLRFAALDDRIRAHQLAYTRARDLLRALPNSPEDFDNALINCQTFLDENAMLLEAPALSALESAYQAGTFLRIVDAQDRQSVIEFRKDIISAPNAIREALGLPPLKLDNDTTLAKKSGTQQN